MDDETRMKPDNMGYGSDSISLAFAGCQPLLDLFAIANSPEWRAAIDTMRDAAPTPSKREIARQRSREDVAKKRKEARRKGAR